jgi:hypothetical protein
MALQPRLGLPTGVLGTILVIFLVLILLGQVSL